MLEPVLKKNDKKAKLLIFIFSIIVFTAITLLAKVKLEVNLGFDVHLFAKANALINSLVAVLLIVALIAVKAKNYKLHKNVIMTAMFLSILFFPEQQSVCPDRGGPVFPAWKESDAWLFSGDGLWR